MCRCGCNLIRQSILHTNGRAQEYNALVTAASSYVCVALLSRTDKADDQLVRRRVHAHQERVIDDVEFGQKMRVDVHRGHECVLRVRMNVQGMRMERCRRNARVRSLCAVSDANVAR